jgi:phage-related protein
MDSRDSIRLARALDPECGHLIPGTGSSVFDLRTAWQRYRSIHIAKLAGGIHVLHAVMKKSKSGRGIPREDIS